MALEKEMGSDAGEDVSSRGFEAGELGREELGGRSSERGYCGRRRAEQKRGRKSGGHSAVVAEKIWTRSERG